MSDMLSALILGIVEGLTEFLPVSSTGHMIIVGHMIGFDGNLAKIFDVVIQLGAILSVLVLYRGRFARFFTKDHGVRSPRPFLYQKISLFSLYGCHWPCFRGPPDDGCGAKDPRS